MYSSRQRSKKYDELYTRALKILNEFNPCKIENGTCMRGRNGGCNFCCDGCSNLSKKGCTVKSLYCKTWICKTAATVMSDKYMMFDKLMTQIDNEARKYNLYIFRAGKLEILGKESEGKQMSSEAVKFYQSLTKGELIDQLVEIFSQYSELAEAIELDKRQSRIATLEAQIAEKDVLLEELRKSIICSMFGTPKEEVERLLLKIDQALSSSGSKYHKLAEAVEFPLAVPGIIVTEKESGRAQEELSTED